MQFPYPNLRKQQSDFINDVSEVLANSNHLIADAPTGLGKTIGVLYPALNYALENRKTVFFLTSRHNQHKIVIDTLKMLNSSAKFRATDIIGKKWLCSYDVSKMDNSMFSNFCRSMIDEKRCKFYSNTKHLANESIELTEDAKQALRKIKNQSPMHSEKVHSILQERFCAYELLIECARTSSVIVCDYFHIFSPLGSSFLRKTRKNIENSIIIVDEAHNLPNRIRNHLSSKLSTRALSMAIEEADQFGFYEISKEIRKVIEVFRILKNKLKHENEIFIEKNELIELISKYADFDVLVAKMLHTGTEILRERKKSFVESTAVFLDSWEKGHDIGYARILAQEKIQDKEHLALYYSCLDPSIISAPIISASHSTILMSGTLKPMEMYRDVLGFDQSKTKVKSYSSPFPKENRIDIVVASATTLYKERAKNLNKISDIVSSCIRNIKGNVAVFFPSYELMHKVRNNLNWNLYKMSKPLIVEKQGMSKKEKAEMYKRFADSSEKGAALFGVIAGSFSEGIDLPGNLLNGVVVVGLPLEKPSKSTEALINYYQKLFKKGREYGYEYPALVKVIQAAGRCIRTETDKGACIFIDKRFLWQNYKKFLPENIRIADDPEKVLADFYNNIKQS